MNNKLYIVIRVVTPCIFILETKLQKMDFNHSIPFKEFDPTKKQVGLSKIQFPNMFLCNYPVSHNTNKSKIILV